MPETNQYLTENKKPVELVQELKDEYRTPSYEEFIRDYEVDKKVNDNYESEFDSKNNVAILYRYGPGNDQSKTAGKVVGSLALAGLTAVCPPAGLAVGGGVAAGGATAVGIGLAENNEEAVETGLEMISVGGSSAITGASGLKAHSGKNCPLPICPKK